VCDDWQLGSTCNWQDHYDLARYIYRDLTGWGGSYFSNNIRASLFNKRQSKEPNFGRIISLDQWTVSFSLILTSKEFKHEVRSIFCSLSGDVDFVLAVEIKEAGLQAGIFLQD
jgi:hypothetical protein